MPRPFLIPFLLAQTACTSVLWNGGIYDADRAIQTQRQITRTQSDTIHAISQIPRHANPQLSGSLILQGEHYWYAIHPRVSQDLAAPLRAPLLHQLKGAADLYGLGVVGIAGEQLLQQLLCFVALAFFRQRPRAQKVVFDDVRVAGVVFGKAAGQFEHGVVMLFARRGLCQRQNPVGWQHAVRGFVQHVMDSGVAVRVAARRRLNQADFHRPHIIQAVLAAV